VDGVTTDQKIHYVADTLLRMMRKELRVLAEASCPIHGRKDVSGPAFSSTFFSLGACEVVGALDAQAGVSGFAATRAFIARVGTLAGSTRFADVAGPLFGYFPHGIAHSFLPKAHGEITGVAMWINNECADEIVRDAKMVDQFRRRHLQVRAVGDVRAFEVNAIILYLDVDRAIADFQERLKGRAVDLVSFERNFDIWEADNEKLIEKFATPTERIALGLGR
jgi:hypothetical protein